MAHSLMTMNEAEAVRLLREICRQDGQPDASRRFQAAVWNAAGGTLGPSDDLLRELAYDLDFYEPDAAAPTVGSA